MTWQEKTLLYATRKAEAMGMDDVSLKLFNDVIQRGRREPITEKDFPEESINMITQLVEDKFSKDGKQIGQIDYPDYQGRQDAAGVRHALGAFRYSIDPDGSITIQDKYDFNKIKEHKWDQNSIIQTLALAIDPIGLGGNIGRKVIPDTGGEGIKVNIKIPAKRSKLSKELDEALEQVSD